MNSPASHGPSPEGRLRVRHVRDDDHDALREVWCAAWEATYRDIDFRARWPAMWVQWQDDCAAGSLAIVVENAGAIVGFALFDPLKAYLDQLAVAPGRFGSPLAGRLLHFVRGHCGGRLVLDVNQGNPRAVRFYEREGFRRIGESVNPLSTLPTWRYEWCEPAGTVDLTGSTAPWPAPSPCRTSR